MLYKWISYFNFFLPFRTVSKHSYISKYPNTMLKFKGSNAEYDLNSQWCVSFYQVKVSCMFYLFPQMLVHLIVTLRHYMQLLIHCSYFCLTIQYISGSNKSILKILLFKISLAEYSTDDPLIYATKLFLLQISQFKIIKSEHLNCIYVYNWTFEKIC